jgi:phosphoserine phosphatase
MHSSLNYQNTRVILLHQEQGTYNLLKLFPGSRDRHNLKLLTGEVQATDNFLKNMQFDAIYASPLQRAGESARELLKAIAQNIEPETVKTVPQHQETKCPQWEELPFEVAKDWVSQNSVSWKQNQLEFPLAVSQNSKWQNTVDLSPSVELYSRIERFWQEILPRHRGETILIVSHSGTNRALISTALGVSPDRYHSIEQSNCAVNILNFANSCLDSGKIEALNHLSHVGGKIPAALSDRGMRLLLVPTETRHPCQLQSLAEFLKDVKIDFSISDSLDRSVAISDDILKYHPTAVQLAVLQENFPQVWQETINTKNSADAGELITGLVITSDRSIQDFLAQVLGMNPERLHLHSNTVSIIHYHTWSEPPTIQGLNLTAA